MSAEKVQHGIRDVKEFVDTEALRQENGESLVRSVLTVILGWAQTGQLRLSKDDRNQMVPYLREKFDEKGADIDAMVKEDHRIQKAWDVVAA